jgi:hypothetical protein
MVITWPVVGDYRPVNSDLNQLIQTTLIDGDIWSADAGLE